METRPASARLFQDASSYTFRQRHGNINWRELQSLDLGHVIEQGNVQKLSDVIENVTYGQLTGEDFHRFPDQVILKLFQVCQLSLEYLQAQNLELQKRAENTSQDLYANTLSNKKLNEQIKHQSELMRRLKHTLRNRNETLNTYEYIVRQPATAATIQKQTLQYAKCEYCRKYFKSPEFLDSHINRRHPETLRPVAQTPPIHELLDKMREMVMEQTRTISESHQQQIQFMTQSFTKQLEEFHTFSTSEFSTQVVELERPVSAQSVDSELLRQEKEFIEKLRRQKELQMKRLREKQAEFDRLNEMNLSLSLETIELEKQAAVVKKKQVPPPKPPPPSKIDVQKTTPTPSIASLLHDLESRDTPTGRSLTSTENSNKELAQILREVKQDSLNIKAEEQDEYQDEEEELLEIIEVNQVKRELTEQKHKGVADLKHDFVETSSPELRIDKLFLNSMTKITQKEIAKAAEVLKAENPYDPMILPIIIQFLKNPLPKPWGYVKEAGVVKFENPQTKEVTQQHPGVQHYQELIMSKLIQRTRLSTKLQRLLIPIPESSILHDQYGSGIKSVLSYNLTYFLDKRNKIQDKFLDKLSSIKVVKQDHFKQIQEAIESHRIDMPGFDLAFRRTEAQLQELYESRKRTNIQKIQEEEQDKQRQPDDSVQTQKQLKAGAGKQFGWSKMKQHSSFQLSEQKRGSSGISVKLPVQVMLHRGLRNLTHYEQLTEYETDYEKSGTMFLDGEIIEAGELEGNYIDSIEPELWKLRGRELSVSAAKSLVRGFLKPMSTQKEVVYTIDEKSVVD